MQAKGLLWHGQPLLVLRHRGLVVTALINSAVGLPHWPTFAPCCRYQAVASQSLIAAPQGPGEQRGRSLFCPCPGTPGLHQALCSAFLGWNLIPSFVSRSITPSGCHKSPSGQKETPGKGSPRQGAPCQPCVTGRVAAVSAVQGARLGWGRRFPACSRRGVCLQAHSRQHRGRNSSRFDCH